MVSDYEDFFFSKCPLMFLHLVFIISFGWRLGWAHGAEPLSDFSAVVLRGAGAGFTPWERIAKCLGPEGVERTSC